MNEQVFWAVDVIKECLSYLHLGVSVVLNSDRIYNFVHTISYDNVSHLSINGDVIIQSITFEDQSTPTCSLDHTPVFDAATPLHEAAQKGQLNIVNKLLSKGANVNARDSRGVPLWLATEENHYNVVNRLLKVNGIDVNAENIRKSTALHLASQNGFLKIVKLLLKHGADINAQMDGGYRPLHLALQNNRIDVSEFYMKSNTDFSVTDNLKWTFLHSAVHSGISLKIVQQLVEKEIPVNAKIDDDRTALHFAAEFNFQTIAEYLVGCGAKVNAQSDQLWTPLHFAIYHGNLEVATKLLENGADYEIMTIDFLTPLHIAVNRNNIAVVNLLLTKGANANAVGHSNRTALHCASERGYVEVAELLLTSGAAINMTEDTTGATPLHIAAQCRHVALTKFLVENGADVNAKTVHEATALHLAATHSDIVQLLLKNGSYFDSKTEYGNSACDFAELSENKVACQVFEVTKKLFTGITDNSLLAVEQCLKEGVIIDCKSIAFESPLLYATKGGCIEIVNSLLEGGANANINNKDNFTSLHYACQFKHFAILCSLLKHGAIFNVKCGEDKKRPIDFASDMETINLLQLIEDLFRNVATASQSAIDKLLLTKSQNPNFLSAITGARNEKCHTLMQVAVISRNREFAKMLVTELKLSQKL